MGKHWIPDSDPHHLNQKKEDENTDWDWYSETEGELKIHANHKSRHMFIPQMPPTGEVSIFTVSNLRTIQTIGNINFGK